MTQRPPIGKRGHRRSRCGRLWLAVCSVLLVASTASASPMDRLFGLRRLSWSDADANLGWEYPLPAWVWALIALGACGLAAWSYGRLLGPRPVRLVLAGLRALLILAVAVLLAGPVLVDPQEREEPDTLVVLVDRSASMTIGDMPGEGGAVSRDEALRRALVEQAATFGEGGLGGGSRRVVWLGFGEDTYELPPLTEASVWDRPEVAAEADATALRTAIEEALRRTAGSPLASVVVFSDGRTPQNTGAELVRQVASRGAPVHVVPLGAAEPALDLAIGQVDAPREAFAEDLVPVAVTIERRGGGGEEVDPAQVRVRLVDTATDETLDEATLADAPPGEPVALETRTAEPGTARYRVVVEHGDGGELVVDNNVREVEVAVIDRPVRVLYVEGYPRWEYRYLKNTLIREASIDSSMLLLSADRAFAQEGDTPIARPPTSPEEIRPYDVVIIGDVPPGYFTPEQLTLIREHVVGGAGLLWIGGGRWMPGAWEGTPLEDLLPMRSPASVAAAGGAPAVEVSPTALAERLNVLQLRGPDGEAPEGGWPEELPPLRWVQDLGALKPTAEVIAEAPVEASPEPQPILTRLRFGGGQALYLATDESWRWRYGRGELYFEQFWVQLVRMLGRSRVQQAVDRARLAVSHRQVDVEEPVVVEVVVDDPAMAERQLPQVAVTVTSPAPGSAAVTVDHLVLRPEAQEAPSAGNPGGSRRVYRAVWRPTSAGPLTLRVTEPALADLGLVGAIEVVTAEDERRQVEPDHARLAALAAATGGDVVPLDELDRLVGVVPNLAEKVATDVREPLWHSSLAFGVVLGLVGLEWVIRKSIWLV